MKKKSLILTAILLCAGVTFTSCNSGGSPAKSDSSSTSEEIKEGKRVYFAAPLFSQAERDYNLYITHILEEYDYQVFLPQRDGYLAPELAGKTEQEKIDMIFEKDYTEVLKADIFFGILDGRAPDEGVCVELGIAFSNNKRCYGFKTDARAVERDLDLNPMITGCLDYLFYNTDGAAAVNSLKNYLQNHDL